MRMSRGPIHCVVIQTALYTRGNIMRSVESGPRSCNLLGIDDTEETNRNYKIKSKGNDECSRRDSPSPSQHIIFFVNSCYSNPYEILSFSLNFT